MTLPKVSIITCTFGRFSCVERVIKQIYDQDYTGEWEHIIYNTCVEHPLILDSSLIGKNIIMSIFKPMRNIPTLGRFVETVYYLRLETIVVSQMTTTLI